jgi:hypothetical protein
MARNFDENLLKVLFEKEVPLTDYVSAVGRVYSYDGDNPRFKILSRINQRNGSTKTLKQFPPLLNTEHLDQMTNLIKECGTFLDQLNKSPVEKN